MIQVVNVEWRSRLNNFGFVLFFDNITKKYQARFEKTLGYNIEEDIEHVRDHGILLSFKEAKGFFPDSNFTSQEYKT